jgi:hypothetical protein
MIPHKFYYYKIFHKFKEEFDAIEVVVIFRWQFDKANNFILTAYPD